MNIVPPFVRRRIAHRPNLLKIVDNIGWLFFDKVLRMGVGLLVGVWVARYLGPEQFGLFSFATAFVTLFGAIAGLGLQGIVVRDIVRDPACKEEALGTTAVLQLIGGFLAYGLVIGTIFWIRPDDALAKLLVAILGTTMLFKVSDVAVYWFESQVQSKYTVWVQNSVFLVFAAAKVVLILNHAPLVAFAWATMAEALVVALLLGVMLGIRGSKLRQLRATLARAKTLLKDSWPILLSSMFLMAQARIDQVMLGQMVGDLEVGHYSVALRIIETASVTSMILYGSFLPSLVSSKSTSEKIYLKRMEVFYKLNFLVAMVIGVPLAVFSPWIIQILFGSDYMPAALIMSIMTIRLLFAHIGVPRSIYLLNENLLTFKVLTMIAGTLTNIFLNYLMIPIYQGLGATIASLISFFVTTLLLDLLYSKTRANAVLMIKSIFTFHTLFRKQSWTL